MKKQKKSHKIEDIRKEPNGNYRIQSTIIEINNLLNELSSRMNKTHE